MVVVWRRRVVLGSASRREREAGQLLALKMEDQRPRLGALAKFQMQDHIKVCSFLGSPRLSQRAAVFGGNRGDGFALQSKAIISCSLSRVPSCRAHLRPWLDTQPGVELCGGCAGSPLLSARRWRHGRVLAVGTVCMYIPRRLLDLHNHLTYTLARSKLLICNSLRPCRPTPWHCRKEAQGRRLAFLRLILLSPQPHCECDRE